MATFSPYVLTFVPHPPHLQMEPGHEERESPTRCVPSFKGAVRPPSRLLVVGSRTMSERVDALVVVEEGGDDVDDQDGEGERGSPSALLWPSSSQLSPTSEAAFSLRPPQVSLSLLFLLAEERKKERGVLSASS